MSLRGGSVSDRRDNPLYAMGAYGQYGLLTGSQWIATGLRPRDDKEWKEIVVSTICHCEERAEADDAAIHRMQWARTDNYGSLTGSQWIAMGFQPSR